MKTGIIKAIKSTRGIGKRKVLNIANIKRDIQDPDLKSYGKKLPIGNKAIMKASLAIKKRKS